MWRVGPSWSAGVEQGPDSVVSELTEPKPALLMRLMRFVPRFGRRVRDAGPVPVHDLRLPAQQRAAEPVDLWRTRDVLELETEPPDELQRKDTVGVRIDLPYAFLGSPDNTDLASRITGLEQPNKLGPAAVLVDAIVGHREETSAPIERVVLAAPVAEPVVLQPASALIHGLVRQLEKVERIGDLPSDWEHRVEHLATRP